MRRSQRHHRDLLLVRHAVYQLVFGLGIGQGLRLAANPNDAPYFYLPFFAVVPSSALFATFRHNTLSPLFLYEMFSEMLTLGGIYTITLLAALVVAAGFPTEEPTADPSSSLT